MRVREIAALSVLATASLTVGCSAYYKVTEPTSGHVYYTKDIDRKRDGTTIIFTDAKTGSQVVMPASEVVQVPSDEFKKAMAQ